VGVGGLATGQLLVQAEVECLDTLADRVRRHRLACSGQTVGGAGRVGCAFATLAVLFVLFRDLALAGDVVVVGGRKRSSRTVGGSGGGSSSTCLPTSDDLLFFSRNAERRPAPLCFEQLPLCLPYFLFRFEQCLLFCFSAQDQSGKFVSAAKFILNLLELVDREVVGAARLARRAHVAATETDVRVAVVCLVKLGVRKSGNKMTHVESRVDGLALATLATCLPVGVH
jgi:hypothetical protein